MNWIQKEYPAFWSSIEANKANLDLFESETANDCVGVDVGDFPLSEGMGLKLTQDGILTVSRFGKPLVQMYLKDNETAGAVMNAMLLNNWVAV